MKRIQLLWTPEVRTCPTRIAVGMEHIGYNVEVFRARELARFTGRHLCADQVVEVACASTRQTPAAVEGLANKRQRCSTLQREPVARGACPLEHGGARKELGVCVEADRARGAGRRAANERKAADQRPVSPPGRHVWTLLPLRLRPFGLVVHRSQPMMVAVEEPTPTGLRLGRRCSGTAGANKIEHRALTGRGVEQRVVGLAGRAFGQREAQEQPGLLGAEPENN